MAEQEDLEIEFEDKPQVFSSADSHQQRPGAYPQPDADNTPANGFESFGQNMKGTSPPEQQQRRRHFDPNADKKRERSPIMQELERIERDG